jgi:hypothetical protein
MSLIGDDPDISIVAAFDRVAEHITGDTRLQQRIRTAGRVIAQWIEAGQKESLGETTSMGVDLLALFRLLDDVFVRVRGLEGQALHVLQELKAKGELITTLDQEARERDTRIEALVDTLQAFTPHGPVPVIVDPLAQQIHRLNNEMQKYMDLELQLRELRTRVEEQMALMALSGKDRAALNKRVAELEQARTVGGEDQA